MTHFGDLREALFTDMGRALQTHGFDPKPVDQSFRRATPFGWACVHLSFIRHPPTDFDVVLNVALRFDAIQDIIQNNADALVSASDKRNSATIGCELGNLMGIGQKRWNISSVSDVAIVVLNMMTFVEANILEFIDTYSDIETVLDVLCTGGEEAKLISVFEDKRQKTIAAILSLEGRTSG